MNHPSDVVSETPVAKGSDFYSEIWDNRGSDMKIYSPMARHTRRWILKLIQNVPNRKSIGDFGCGDGALLATIGASFPGTELFGTDFSESAIANCRRSIKGGRFALHDLRDPTNPFDKILDIGISSEVLEHMDDDESALRNLASWCRYLVLTVPAGTLDETALQMGHVRHYDQQSLSELAERTGLEVLVSRCWGFPFAYPWYARLRNRVGYQAVIGKYSPSKRAMLHGLYAIFFMNDFFRGGNKVFLLARNPALET